MHEVELELTETAALAGTDSGFDMLAALRDLPSVREETAQDGMAVEF